MKLFRCILCVSLGWYFLTEATAQAISHEQLKQIDSLFAEFDQSPPVAYGIIFQDQVLHRQFGKEAFAYLESSPTLYNLGGMAPHFTAYAILLLEEEKKIDLDDKVSQYLDEEKGLKIKGISIRNLLSHSHGLPEYWALKSLAGYTAEDRFTISEAEALFRKGLKKLHPTGEKVSFSGTGPYLLARILEKVTGKDLPTFTQDHIFGPLNMKHTYFTQPGRMGNILSYQRQGEIYEPQLVRHNDNGPAGLLTTMEDLLIWFEHLSDYRRPINQKMDVPIRFQGDQIAENPNGQITYGQQFKHDERGVNALWDYGQIGGFASCVFRFPEHQLTIVTLSKNGIDYNGYLGMQISEILLEDVYQSDNPDEEHTQVLPLTEGMKEKFIGSYFDSEYILYRKIILKNDTLFYYRPDHGDEQALHPISENELEMRTQFGNYRFSIVNKQLQLLYENIPYLYERVPSESPYSIDPTELVGTYLCENWALVLSISQGKEGKLILEADRNKTEIHRVDEQRFVSSHPQYSLLNLAINAEKELEGILVSNIGFKDLLFKKVSF